VATFGDGSRLTRETVLQWIERSERKPGDYLFPSRVGKDKPLSTRHYARLMDAWVGSVGLDPALYGTHSLRRTKVALIYRRTGNLQAVQLLLGRMLTAVEFQASKAEQNPATALALRRDWPIADGLLPGGEW
jgi:site-specific recombinase XerC